MSTGTLIPELKTTTLTPELFHPMDAYWRAANYLAAGQIHLYDYPFPFRFPTKLRELARR